MKHLSCLLSALFALTLCASGEGSALIFAAADGRDYTPLAMGDKKAVVLCFVSPYCPTASSYIPEMNRIAADYGTQASFYFVHSDPDQKLPDILQHTELIFIWDPPKSSARPRPRTCAMRSMPSIKASLWPVPKRKP